MKKPVLTPKKVIEMSAFFTAGNIIHSKYWKRFDEVLAFEIDPLNINWHAMVIQVQFSQGVWQRIGKPYFRRTYPNKHDRVVVRVGEETNLESIKTFVDSCLKTSTATDSPIRTGECMVQMPCYVLEALINMANSHVDDIKDGLVQGVYEEEENADLPDKQAAIEFATQALGLWHHCSRVLEAQPENMSTDRIGVAGSDVEEAEPQYRNHYRCPCGNEWSDVWSSQCDGDCAACGRTIEVDHSDDLVSDATEQGPDALLHSRING